MPYPTNPLPSPPLTGSMVIAGQTYQAQLRLFKFGDQPNDLQVAWVANAGATPVPTGGVFLVTYTFNGVNYEIRNA